MTRWLGVALLPSADHMRSAIKVQEDIGGDHTLRPPLSADGNLPHVTVFQGPFADTLEPGRELELVSRSMSLPKEIHLSFTGVVYQATGWVFLSLERPPLLEKLQEVTLAILNPYLDRAAFDTSKDTSRFTTSEIASYERYGYRYTGEAYVPHMTLGRSEENIAQELVRTAPERVRVPTKWAFDRLSFYVMGEHGAHSETLAETRLDRT